MYNIILFLFTTEVLEASIKWLETNREPWEMVENYWKTTAFLRVKEAKKNRNQSLFEIFQKWPILNHPMGWVLIAHDFEYLKYNTTENSIDQWPQFFLNIQKICPLQKKKIVKAQELLDIIESDHSDESKAIAQLCALSYMIPPKGRIKTKQVHWKPSMIECEESLVVHVKNFFTSTGTPCIIVVGPTLLEISSFFVSIDKILYNVVSAFKAIDTCFKVFHVLNIEYPAASDHIWLLIQRELYKFSTEYDKNPSYILEIISALQNS
ncbi:hypothetical protein PUN28_009827 [Cardiocondyla obscurior]|uniref:Uncharacterized protein n=1 Tax=Cardiocondyla obscurior TaxID=286306 RepID=A0AAW2FRE0_9HYME